MSVSLYGENVTVSQSISWIQIIIVTLVDFHLHKQHLRWNYFLLKKREKFPISLISKHTSHLCVSVSVCLWVCFAHMFCACVRFATFQHTCMCSLIHKHTHTLTKVQAAIGPLNRLMLDRHLVLINVTHTKTGPRPELHFQIVT